MLTVTVDRKEVTYSGVALEGLDSCPDLLNPAVHVFWTVCLQNTHHTYRDTSGAVISAFTPVTEF